MEKASSTQRICADDYVNFFHLYISHTPNFLPSKHLKT